MADIRTSDVIIAFGLGLVAGAAAGVLFAPAPGAETRRRVRDAGERALERTREGAEVARDSVGSKVHGAKDAVREGADRARRAAGDLGHRVETAFKEGREAFLRESGESPSESP